MVTTATDRRAINEREAAVEFDGRWFLLDKKNGSSGIMVGRSVR